MYQAGKPAYETANSNVIMKRSEAHYLELTDGGEVLGVEA